MAHRIRRAFQYWKFGRATVDIFATPPVVIRPGGVRIVSMLNSGDVQLYLISLKSLYTRLPGGTIEVIDDGTLTESDRDLLGRHVPGIDIVRIDTIGTGPCPRGGTWERLLHILDRSDDEYVLQLDADILTLGAVDEVVDAIRRNASFTLGGGATERIVSLEEAAARHGSTNSQATQIVAERALPLLPDGLGRRYVRGSSGFAGFARGASSRDLAQRFSQAMESMLGQRWHEWGTEQVTSSYVIANSRDGFVLPWRRYQCFCGDAAGADVSLLHFIGTWRFQKGVYAGRARTEIARLISMERTAR